MNPIIESLYTWKGVVGLAIIGLATWIIAPTFFLTILPWVLLIVCPLSLVLLLALVHRDTHQEVASLAYLRETEHEE